MLGWDKDFNAFKDALSKGFTAGLPGVEAQYRLVPPDRQRPNFDEILTKNPRKAGVLALFYPVAEVPHLVLMKRNTYPGVHSGQISLPGGQAEDLDGNLIETALRETHEEIGVHRKYISVLGNLTQVYIPPSNFLVQPVIGVSHKRPDFIPEIKEVSELLEVAFTEFFNPANFRETRVEARGFVMQVPAYHINNHIIWGATAMMISEIIALLKSAE
jgi:8-oxo-dGTP pyrophosphatase MutT (NUDIX family)